MPLLFTIAADVEALLGECKNNAAVAGFYWKYVRPHTELSTDQCIHRLLELITMEPSQVVRLATLVRLHQVILSAGPDGLGAHREAILAMVKKEYIANARRFDSLAVVRALVPIYGCLAVVDQNSTT